MYSKFGVALACTHVIIHTVKSFLTSGTCEVFVLRFVKHRPVANMFSCLAIFVFKLFCVAIFNPPDYIIVCANHWVCLEAIVLIAI